MSKVAIIIINYNEYEKTKECIKIIRKKTKADYHIYLLENGSANDSLAELKKYCTNASDVTLVASENNLGYARGNNRLLELAEKDGSQYAVIMNNDVFLVNNAIDIMIDNLQNDAGISMVGPHMVGTKGELQLTAKSECSNGWQYLCRETLLGRFFPKYQSEWLTWQNQQKNKAFVYWLSGAIFAVRMTDFKRIGFFDPFTFLYYEEYIIAEKAKNEHLKLVYEPAAKVLHQHGGSTKSGVNVLTRSENFRSELYFLRKYKNWSKASQIGILLIRFIETFIFWRKDLNCLKTLKKYAKFGIQQIKDER